MELYFNSLKNLQLKKEIIMATSFTNQASIAYQYSTAAGTVSETKLSNIASGEITGPIALDKTVLGSNYKNFDEKTYIITVKNTSPSALNNVVITDNLGTDIYEQVSATPLTLRSDIDPILLINGQNSTDIKTDATSSNQVVFTIGMLPADSFATIIFSAIANQAAPLTASSQITNTALATADNIAETVSASSTITADNYADVSIIKSMSPSSIVSGSTITYTFDLYNYGNVDATNVTLTDVFSPILSDIQVYQDGALINPSAYSYEADGTLTLPSAAYTPKLTIPAATFVRDTATGAITINPGTIQIVVTGTI